MGVNIKYTLILFPILSTIGMGYDYYWSLNREIIFMVSLYDIIFTMPNLLVLWTFYMYMKTMEYAENNQIEVSEQYDSFENLMKKAGRSSGTIEFSDFEDSRSL